MTYKTVEITDREFWLEKRGHYVTSTQSAALFGLEMSMASTAFELWHIKNGLMDDTVQDNNFMQWGRLLEPALVNIIKDDNPEWEVNELNIFAYNDDIRIGSSFDCTIEHPEKGHCLLEIKTATYARFMQGYIIDDESDFIEAPEYYEFQCQHELECYGKADWICLAVFLLDTREIKYIWRERDQVMGNGICRKIQEFWSMQNPPAPDLEKDSDLLARLHRANNKDKSYDGTENIDFDIATLAYLQESENEKNAKQNKKKIRSEIILAMEDCNTAWSNSARVANKKSFRVTATKEK